MTVLDWAIIAFTIALALWGYRQGLIVGALTLVGFGAGAFAGSRLAPLVLSEGAESPYAPLCQRSGRYGQGAGGGDRRAARRAATDPAPRCGPMGRAGR
jgi:hypothetical protein